MGFDEERQQQTIAALSGGWKMKLSLGRAMLMKADILVRRTTASPVCVLPAFGLKSLAQLFTSDACGVALALLSELSSVPRLHPQ
jgi:hypothetical protein